jgi:FK506-binding protein 2
MQEVGQNKMVVSVGGRFCLLLLLAPSVRAMRPAVARGSSRRQAILCGAAAAGVPLTARAMGEGFAGKQQAEIQAFNDVERRKRLEAEKRTDPYAETRAADPSRGSRFADELPSLPQEERVKRAEAAKRAAQNPRAAPQVSKSATDGYAPTATATDEFTVDFDPQQGPLGLKLKDLRVGTEYGTTGGTSRVLVMDVTLGGQAANSGKVSIDDIVVAVDGVNVETESAKQISARLADAKSSGRSLVSVTFKDALVFNARLNTPASGEEVVATKVAPATETSEAQVLAVKRISVPDGCRRTASEGDLLEIRYTGRLADGTVFDGMQLADRFGDDSIQFVLGRQPAGQFPPSWDLGLVGMCVGERRELDVPPVLGFGKKGLPKRNVPPDARLIYDVELLAINALSTP